MKQKTLNPLGENSNGAQSLGDESAVQEHLIDKDHILTDDDIRNYPVVPVSEEFTEGENESENNRLKAEITEDDPDYENKQGSESPWNIFS